MLSKSQIKYIQSLSHKKLREEEGVFIAEGPKLIGDLCQQQNLVPVGIYALPEWADRLEEPLKNQLEAFITIVDSITLQRLSQLQHAHEVLGVFKKPVFPVKEHALLLMLDNIQDPGNLGTIIRIADWYGISKIICSKESADAFNSKVVQSTMGSIARVEVVYADLISFLENNKQPVYATVLGGKPLAAIGKITEGIIVTGNEGQGISKSVLDYATHTITIPRLGKAESLNAAVATGIVLSHVVGLEI